MLGNLGGTNEANFSKTPSYSLSISRGSFSIGFSWSILSICVGMKSWWPSEAVMDEHKTLLMVFKLLFKGTLQKCMEYFSNQAKCIEMLCPKLHFASHFVAKTAPSIFSFSSSHSRKHLCFRHWNTCKTWISWPRSFPKNPTIFKAQKLLKGGHCQSKDVESQARYHIATNHIWDLRGGGSDTCINWTP